MATLIQKMTITSICVAATMFTACAKPSNGVRGTRAISDPAKSVSDASTLGYFSLPKVNDPNLRNTSELSDANYALTMIQTYTVSHVTKVAAAFEQKLINIGEPHVDDAVRSETARSENDDKKDYRLSTKFNLPLELSIRIGTIAIGTVKEYRNQVITDGQQEWTLNTTPDATAISPSVEETLNHPTKDKGVYSYAPSADVSNTAYVTLENEKLNIYLKTQLKNETMYVRLEYASVELNPNQPALDPSAPAPSAPATAAPAPADAPSAPVAAVAAPATLEMAQTGTVTEQMSILMTEATKVIGVALDLEVDPRGKGTPSFFDPSATEPGKTLDEQLLLNELPQIRQLLGAVASSNEIRTLMNELKVGAIQIINPYNSRKRSGVVYQNGRTTLLLELTLSAPQIVDVLKNAKDFPSELAI